MKKFFLVLAILFCASLARAQGQGNTVMVFSGSAFSGACSGIMLGSDIVNGNLYWCAGPTYTWVKMSGATPTPTFTSVTAGSFISTGPGPWTTLTERANVITPAAGVDICDQDSTAHGILCSQNGGVAQGIVTGGTCQASQSCAAPLAKPLHIWAGSFTFSSTSQAVTGLATLCPNAILSVWASSQSHAYAYQISSISTAGFTITTTSNTDVWNWGVACY